MNIRSLTKAVVLLSALLVCEAHAQFGAAPAELSVIKLDEGLYVISNVAVPGLVTALVTYDGVLLVDDKFEIDHDSLMTALRTVTDQPVKYVINTHYHGDHSGGNAKLQALGAIAVASSNSRKHMVASDQPGQPVVTADGVVQIHLGGKTVEIHPVGPAHTDGDVVVLFPDYRVLASGDIFANGPGTSAQLVDYNGGGSAKAWPKAIDQALSIDGYDTVVPGHGVISTRADLQAYRERAQRFSDTLAEMVGQNKPRSAIEEMVRTRFDWEDFHVNSALNGLIEEYR